MGAQISVPLMVTVGVCVLAGWIDFARFRIPNAITVPFLLAGLVYHAATKGLEGFYFSAGGCVTCFLIVLVLYLMGAMGAGDVKFTAGIGAWLGVHLALWVFLAAAIGTALFSIIIMVSQGGLTKLADSSKFVVFQLYRFKVLARHLAGVPSIEAIADSQDRRKRLIPFATMLAAGVIVIVIWKIYYPG